MKTGKLGLIVLIAAIPAAASAQVAGRQDCATYAELQTVAAFVLPGVIGTVAARGGPPLGPRAVLNEARGPLSRRLRAVARSWEAASPSFTKISRMVAGTGLGGAFASGAVVQRLVADALTDAFKLSDCEAIDAGLASLANLPASRMVDFLATGFAAVGASSNLKLCKEP